MKKYFVSMLLVVAVIFTNSGISIAATTWQNVGDPVFSSTAVTDSSIVFDSNNVPYVAFIDANSKAEVMKYTGGSWQFVGAEGTISDGTATEISLAFDSNNVPYVAFNDSANSGALTVMKYVDGGWGVVGSAGFSDVNTSGISIALDSNDVPYVAYIAPDGASMMKYIDGSWQKTLTLASDPLISESADASFTSIVIDSNNVIYTAFRDGSCLVVLKNINGVGSTLGDCTINSNPTIISIVLDSNNVPYVVYSDSANSYKSTVVKYVDGSWQTVGSAGFSDYEPSNLSIALDSNNVPYVVSGYYDGVSYYNFVYRYVDGSWQRLASEAFANGVLGGISSRRGLAIDSSNIPYIVFPDNTVRLNGKSGYATVMKYPEAYVVPSPSHTPSSSSSRSGRSSISSRIKNLVSIGNTTLAQQLASQFNITQPIVSQTTTVPGCPTSMICTPQKYVFNRDLQLWSVGNDVKALQQYLNSKGYLISETGNGSLGHETNTFGMGTLKALVKYQEAKGITPASGFFGPKTRGELSK